MEVIMNMRAVISMELLMQKIEEAMPFAIAWDIIHNKISRNTVELAKIYCALGNKYMFVGVLGAADLWDADSALLWDEASHALYQYLFLDEEE